MRVSSIEAIFRALNSRGVSYLVVGGLAVNAHGYGRATFDIDLVVDLESANIHALFEALSDLGYQPIVPVTAADFANDDLRERWRADKGMVVLQFFSDQHRATRVDVFAHAPFNFDEEYAKAMCEEVQDGVPVPFVALQTLIGMKEEAGRTKDLDDVESLRLLAAEADDEP